MDPEPAIVLKSLREQVYGYLRSQLRKGALKPGAYLDLGAMARSLGVSKTPMRDALLQLEAEGFVSIVPRKGVLVRDLDAADIREIYQILGALEGSALAAAAPALGPGDLRRLRELDGACRAAIAAGDPEGLHAANFAFHDLFLERCGNARILRTVHTLRQQLYDWNRKFETLDPAWERQNLDEHEVIVGHLERGEAEAAAAFLRDVHWSFKVQEPFVRRAYFQD